MDYLNELGAQYEGLIALASGIFGLLGFMFGVWRYLKERRVRQDLKYKQKELDDALSHMKHLETFASGIKQYSAAM